MVKKKKNTRTYENRQTINYDKSESKTSTAKRRVS